MASDQSGNEGGKPPSETNSAIEKEKGRAPTNKEPGDSIAEGRKAFTKTVPSYEIYTKSVLPQVAMMPANRDLPPPLWSKVLLEARMNASLPDKKALTIAQGMGPVELRRDKEASDGAKAATEWSKSVDTLLTYISGKQQSTKSIDLAQALKDSGIECIIPENERAKASVSNEHLNFIAGQFVRQLENTNFCTQKRHNVEDAVKILASELISMTLVGTTDGKVYAFEELAKERIKTGDAKQFVETLTGKIAKRVIALGNESGAAAGTPRADGQTWSDAHGKNTGGRGHG